MEVCLFVPTYLKVNGTILYMQKSWGEQLDEVNMIVCDKGYDSETLRAYIGSKGGKTVIPKRNYGQNI